MTATVRAPNGRLPVAKKKTGPPPKPEGRRDAIITMKCWRAYKLWVEEFARSKRTTPSQLIDMALIRMAEADGFKAAPER